MPDVKIFFDRPVFERIGSTNQIEIMLIACRAVAQKFYPDDWRANFEKIGCRVFISEKSLHVAEISVEVSFTTGKHGFSLRQITNQFKEELRDALLHDLEDHVYTVGLAGSIDVWPGPRPGAAFASSTKAEWLERKKQG